MSKWQVRWNHGLVNVIFRKYQTDHHSYIVLSREKWGLYRFPSPKQQGIFLYFVGHSDMHMLLSFYDDIWKSPIHIFQMFIHVLSCKIISIINVFMSWKLLVVDFHRCVLVLLMDYMVYFQFLVYYSSRSGYSHSEWLFNMDWCGGQREGTTHCWCFSKS